MPKFVVVLTKRAGNDLSFESAMMPNALVYRISSKPSGMADVRNVAGAIQKSLQYDVSGIEVLNTIEFEAS